MADGEYALNQQSLYGPGEGSAPITAAGERNEESSRPTRKLRGLLLGFVVLAVHHFIEGTISFQNVGLNLSQHLARKEVIAGK